MSFLAEDGTGLALANSYCTVAEADAYFLDRNNAKWVGANLVKQGALVQATDYIELRFSHLFYGTKKLETQALSFPRVSDMFVEMPVGLKRACFEYALRSLPGILLPDPVIDSTGMGVERIAKRIGPIEKEIRYQYQGAGTIRTIIHPYPAADGLLKGLFRNLSGTVIRG